MALCKCLREYRTAFVESEEVALVESDGTERKEVAYVELYQWQKQLRTALNGGDEGLVIGISLMPFSIEETTTMLLVAEEKEWSYVPIEVELSLSRQILLLQSAGARRLVTTAKSPLAKYFGGIHRDEVEVVELASSSFGVVQVVNFSNILFNDTEFDQKLKEDEGLVSPLYVLFTSGTTGEPRGVVGARTGAWTRLKWMWTTYPFDESERVLRATKLSFVDSVWEILGAFLGRVPLVHVQSPRDPASAQLNLRSVVLDNSTQFLEVIQSENVTRFTAVPSVLEVLLLQTTEKDRNATLSGLRYVLSSGEALRLHVLQQLTTNLPDATILNLYGSTELSGDVTCMELKAPFSSAQIAQWQQHGVPIANLDRYGVVGGDTSLLLLADELDKKNSTVIWPKRTTTRSEATKARSKGILCISGPLLSFGYIGDGHEGAYVDSDDLPGVQNGIKQVQARRWFCTGDICSVVQGRLYYCGRKDDVVKINGQRVDLEAVERAVATALKATAKVGGDHRIIALASTKEVSDFAIFQQSVVAFIVCDDTRSTAITRYSRMETLNAWIFEHYGALLTPHEILLLPSTNVPRLAHGKIDRRALAKILEHNRNDTKNLLTPVSKGAVSPETFIAQSLEGMLGISLSECLSGDVRARTFADLGGNSLLATLFLHQLQQKFGALCIDLLEMTIGEVLSIVDQRQKATTEEMKRPIKPKTRSTDEPSDGIKRRKKTHHERVSADSAVVERAPRSQPCQLSCLSRYNQSSMGVNGIYLPTCYIPVPTAKPRVVASSSPSLPWALRTAWRVDLRKCIDASPLVAQRRDHTDAVCSAWAIVGSHSGQVVCVDILAAGHEIWRVTLDDRIEACAALSLKHEIVYVGTYGGTLFALDLQTGGTRWTFQATGAIKASAVVMEQQELVVFGAYDSNFYGLEAETGQLQWKLDVRGSLFSTPLYCKWSKQLFVAVTNGNVVSITSTSDDNFRSIQEHWRLQLAAPVFAGLNADFELNLLLVGCADGNLYGVTMTTGEILWQVATEKPIFSSPCVYRPGSVVFGSHDGMLRKVDSRTGELVWATSLNGAVFASPMVVHLVANGATEDDNLVCCVATTTGQLCFCDERTGAIVYQTGDSTGKAPSDAIRTANEGDLGPLFGSPVIIDSLCLLGTRTNYLYGLDMISTRP
ncbi:PQQ-like domain [Phytophthora infestans]|uniref:PQQ-like domain n=1 Tax=Phytophthora infestans TaxID=4787 RepID=A0A833STI9_PHYIN|nr:PQQ-like domain [Phytophthora infestans]